MKGIFGFGKKKDAQNASDGLKEEDGKENIAVTSPIGTGKWLITYDRKKCIGSGTCAAVCEKHWEMREDGKAMLIGSILNESTGVFEKLVDDSDFEMNKMAAEGCPPNCIHVTNKETGEKIV